MIDDHDVVNSRSRSLIVIRAITQCSIVGQATLVGQVLATVSVDGQSPGAVGRSCDSVVRYQIKDTCSPTVPTLSLLTSITACVQRWLAPAGCWQLENATENPCKPADFQAHKPGFVFGQKPRFTGLKISRFLG